MNRLFGHVLLILALALLVGGVWLASFTLATLLLGTLAR